MLTCPCGRESEQGLCYTKCKKGYVGVGPVCYAKCPKGLNQCGLFCLPPGLLCLEKTKCLLVDIGHIVQSFIPHKRVTKGRIEIERKDLKHKVKKHCKKCKKTKIVKIIGIIPGCKKGKCKIKICHERKYIKY